jgi:hypothetical protein
MILKNAEKGRRSAMPPRQDVRRQMTRRDLHDMFSRFDMDVETRAGISS